KIQFATLDRTAEGDTDAHQFIGSLKTGYDFVFGKWSLTPMTEIDYSKAWIQSYAETGAQSLNLVYSPQEVESITSKTGMTINHEFTWGTTQLQPFLQTSYVHEFSGHPSSVQTRFVSGSSFETSIPEADPDYVEMGGGIAIQWDSRWRLKLSYQTDLARSSYESHRLDANLSFSF
ncbi:MAG: autotransporter outer membrane beta-barrel domain-containing protein, partial [Verrucomicrobiota bacterium]